MSHRTQKFSSQLKREISELIRLNIAKEYGLVTLTDVEVTADFKDAKVFITVYEDKFEEKVLNILNKKTIDFQHILGRKLKVKFTPRLTFKIDKYRENLEKVDKLLEEINHES